MKALTAIALLLALSVVALAKPAPVYRPSLALVYADINIGSVGAMLDERDYFLAPQSTFNAGAFPCRLEPVLFHTMRLAQSYR
jgi:hypothetical protein